MKKLLLVLLIATASCNTRTDKYKFSVQIYSGSGLNYGYSIVFCDSANLFSKTEGEVFVDGIKMKIFSDQLITIKTN